MAEISIELEKTFFMAVTRQILANVSLDISAISQGILLQYGSFGSLTCNRCYKVKSIESIKWTIID